MLPKKHIGIFDSGIGGLTVLKEIRELLPQYDYIYLGDNARAPYGTRSFEVVHEYTLQAVKRLFELNCDLIVIACNTASAKALRQIQQTYLKDWESEKRVLGVIRPTTELAGELSSTKEIGILGTSGTVSSNSYQVEINKFHPAVKVHQQACPLWVPLIENQEYDTEGGRYFIKRYVDELMATGNIDTIILACTHYPIIEDLIKEYLPKEVQLISQGKIVAERLQNYLERHQWLENKLTKKGSIHYLTTENPSLFDEKSSLFLGEEVQSELMHW
ncbi:MAG: glutamate racemase [Crocinitomicaceae bacterium]